jgi:hypothetical protein
MMNIKRTKANQPQLKDLILQIEKIKVNLKEIKIIIRILREKK